LAAVLLLNLKDFLIGKTDMRRDLKFQISLPALWLFIFLMPLNCFLGRAQARPVAFLGAWSLMNENRIHQNQLMGSYTLGREWSLGFHFSSFEGDQGRDYFLAPVVSYLVLRENEDRRQTNVYLTAGSGRLIRYQGGTQSVAAAVMALDADTETRTVYSALRSEWTKASDGHLYLYSRARLGFAPYSAAVGGLHTWVLLQTDYDKWKKHSEITPMLRFFFQNMLWEMGVSLKGSFQFHWATEV
jgi:hypothetical protein